MSRISHILCCDQFSRHIKIASKSANDHGGGDGQIAIIIIITIELLSFFFFHDRHIYIDH